MTLRGSIQPDHIPQNSFQLIVFGLPPITFTEVGEFLTKLQTTKLPDRTMASGGALEPVAFNARVPLHHTLEILALDAWLEESRLGLPTYKKIGTLINFSLSGLRDKTWALTGLFIHERKSPTLKMDNEGDAGEMEYQFSADRTDPIT